MKFFTSLLVLFAFLRISIEGNYLFNFEHENVFNMLVKYKQEHNVVIMNELKTKKELCNQKFVIGTYSCPMQVGNRMHEFLNAFAGALITNRTLLWHYCDRIYCKTNESVCEVFLFFYYLYIYCKTNKNPYAIHLFIIFYYLLLINLF
jgi:hypothetical protein